MYHHGRESLGHVFAADAPWMQPDDTRRIEVCRCGKSMAWNEEDDRWEDVTDRWLPDAQKTPDGKMVCGPICYSQAMYEAADTVIQVGLDHIAKALLALIDDLDEATIKHLDKWLPQANETQSYGRGMDELRLIAQRAFDNLSQVSEPEWLNK